MFVQLLLRLALCNRNCYSSCSRNRYSVCNRNCYSTCNRDCCSSWNKAISTQFPSNGASSCSHCKGSNTAAPEQVGEEEVVGMVVEVDVQVAPEQVAVAVVVEEEEVVAPQEEEVAAVAQKR